MQRAIAHFVVAPSRQPAGLSWRRASNCTIARCPNPYFQGECGTSRDLYNWEKHPENPLFHPSPRWSPWAEAESWPGTSCRDPHVIRVDGEYVLYYVCATRRPGECAVAHAVSGDLVHWEDRGPVFRAAHSLQIGQCMTESPCVVFVDGRWHLFYTQGRGLHWAVSETPFRFENPAFFCSAHASEVFPGGEGEWLVSNCAKPPGRSHIRMGADGADRRLWLARLEFSGGEPRLRELGLLPEA